MTTDPVPRSATNGSVLPTLTERPVKHGHTSWRVYCRWDPEDQPSREIPCQEYPLPRLSRKAAVETAREHTTHTGHPSEVVKVRYDSVLEVSRG